MRLFKPAIAAVLPVPHAAEQLGAWVVDKAIAGIGPLVGAPQLCRAYLDDQAYAHNEARIDALCRREIGKSLTAGFISGLSGMLTLPLTIPTSLGAIWILQARMAAGVAHLRGHDVYDPFTRSLIFSCLLGSAAPEMVRRTGVRVAEWAAQRALVSISDQTILQFNRRIGVRLLREAGGRGALRLGRLVPVAGAAVGGVFDAIAAKQAAQSAKRLFAPPRLLQAASDH